MGKFSPKPTKAFRINDKAPGQKEHVDLDDDGSEKKFTSSFYRGETINFHPQLDDFSSDTFLEKYMFKGWMPPKPILTKGMKITAFGSCFAYNITNYLSSIGYNLSSNRDPDIYISRMGDGLVNSHSILGQFEWALENKKQPEDMWHGFKAEGFGYDEDIRLRTGEIFRQTEFFIITIGISEIWYDEPSGGVFWRAVPMKSFDASRHKFRVSSVEETRANIAEIYRLIRKHAPDAKVLFTLSPIPAAATFRDASCISASIVSKAIIRSAMDEFVRSMPDELNNSLFYFPAYEMVMNAFANPWREDLRHPRAYVIETIMKCFEAIYCLNETSMADANVRYQEARRENMVDVAKQAKYLEMASSPDDPAAQARLAKRAAKKAAKIATKKSDTKESVSEEARAAKRALRKAEKQAA
jgi:hypothetical protein